MAITSIGFYANRARQLNKIRGVLVTATYAHRRREQLIVGQNTTVKDIFLCDPPEPSSIGR